MTVSIDCDVDEGGGRDCNALRRVWRGIAESIEQAFFRCFRMRCSPKEGTRGRTARFSMDEAVLIAVGSSLREDSSEVRLAGCCVTAGVPPISVVTTDALYGASWGQWTLVCGGCGDSGRVGLLNEASASTGLRSEKLELAACGDRSGWTLAGLNGSPFLIVADNIVAKLCLVDRAVKRAYCCEVAASRPWRVKY
jgi:hypothetical protein